MTALYDGLSFRYPFRKYQRMILEQVVGRQKDQKYHLVAPPGAGKTIIGLELLRQLGEPAVVFAPTTTIQAQWHEKLQMFITPPATVSQFASMDAHEKAPIHIFTYQLISTPAEAQEHIRQAALTLWQDELVHAGQVPDTEAAQARLVLLRQNNPEAYRKDALRYANRVKKRLLHEPDAEIGPFLHPNARQLIDDLVAAGVRTVVLDECHHLLDYWAIVLRYLIRRIESPHVIGLTATLPSPEDDQEFENYESLLGEVDFEIPTPAVVKEGDLAPYRDLLYLVKPTRRETEYLSKIQTEFEAAISMLTQYPRFAEWVRGFGVVPPGPADPLDVWQRRWDEHPMLMLAATRLLNINDLRPDSKLPTPIEAFDPLELQDWNYLIERFGLDVLKTSADSQDHLLLTQLRAAILPFGLTLTERGLMQSRSPGDLVLSFSESKDRAAANVLSAEWKAMGERLRAIIVTDFERAGAGVRQMQGVLENDAGSAVRLFASLAVDARVSQLCPTLVTGSLFMVPADAAEALLEQFTAYLRGQNLKAICSIKPTKNPQVVEITGSGPDWTSRTYIRMATAAFERGDIKCLVGTRGIFGEGWDSLSLNTLIDLTTVTTSTAVQQLRGRTLRLDANWPRKVAHNWDIVCVAPGFRRGSLDFERFLERHRHYWSLVIYNDWFEEQTTPNASAPPYLHGRVVKGAVHVNPALISSLLQSGRDGIDRFSGLGLGMHNRRTMRQIGRRDQVYDLWQIGGDYSNFSYTSTLLNAQDLKIKTVFTLETTLKRLLRLFFTTFVFLGLIALRVALEILLSGMPAALGLALFCFIGVFGVLSLIILAFNAQTITQLVKSLFTAQLPDAILLDVGRALLETLRETGDVSRNLQADYVRAIRMPTDTYQVLLDYASPEDAQTFIQAFGEIFAPVRDQRYLIMRTEDRLPNLPLRMLWLPLRLWVRETGMYPPAYHPVPKILSSRKERVDIFAKYWEKYVGGGQVVFTRSEQGRAVLLAARAQRRPKVQHQAFETWK